MLPQFRSPAPDHSARAKVQTVAARLVQSPHTSKFRSRRANTRGGPRYRARASRRFHPMLAVCFVIAEQEGLVLLNGTAECGAKIIALKLWYGALIEKIA